MRRLGSTVPHLAAADTVGADDLVIELTAETYEYFMRRTSMAGLVVLLEVYSDRCPHCINFVPNFTRTAQRLKQIFPHNAIVARLDGAKQIVPRELDIRYYPSFFAISPAFDRPIAFNGDRSTDALVEFVHDVIKASP